MASPLPRTPQRRPSTDSVATVGSAMSASSPGQASGRARLQSIAIDTLLSSTMASITSTPPRLPVAKNKEPLSLPTTTRNFRGFVQKSGPIFYFQDAVEATLAWDDWAWTSMWMGIWAIIALHPHLLLCAPTAIIAVILIRTHQARFPVGHAAGAKDPQASAAAAKLETQSPAESLAQAIQNPSSTGHGAVLPPVMPNPPHEGSIKYYENLRDIQNMMKMVTDGYDAVAPVVPYLNWSSYRRTLLLFQVSLVTTIVMFFLGPFVPLRPILLIAGEGAFIATHPWVLPAVTGLMKKLDEEKRTGRTPLGRELGRIESKNREILATLRQLYEEDGFDDNIWERGWRDIEMFQNERYAKGRAAYEAGWSAHNLQFGERRAFTKGSDGWTPENSELEAPGYEIDVRKVAMKLEPGWEWIEGDDWRIDWVGKWSPTGVDAEGFVYTDNDWQSASPYPFGHAGHPRYPLPPPEENVGGFSMGRFLQQARTAGAEEYAAVFGNGDEGASNESDETASSSVLTGMEIRDAKAATRRRRWLRRAVFIGKPPEVEVQKPIWEGRKD